MASTLDKQNYMGQDRAMKRGRLFILKSDPSKGRALTCSSFAMWALKLLCANGGGVKDEGGWHSVEMEGAPFL